MKFGLPISPTDTIYLGGGIERNKIVDGTNLPQVYKAWDRIFENIENLVDNKNYLKEMSGKIREFTDLVEENHKKSI